MAGMPGRKRKRDSANRKWSPEEDRKICEKLRETVVGGGKIEHPTAKAYYERLLSELEFQDVNYVKMKAKVANLKSTYLRMIDWRSQTGQGVLETDGPETVKAYILSKCPLFDLLDEIFGSKVNVNPPIIIETGLDIFDDDQDEVGGEDLSSNTTELQNSQMEQRSAIQVVGDSGIVTFTPITPRGQKRKSADGLTLLTDVQKQRVDIMERKLDCENQWKTQQMELEQNKLEFEEKKLVQDMEIRKLELEQSERIEKYRIDQEMLYKLEIAKLQFQK